MVCFVALFHLKLGICPCISSTEINSLKCFHKQTGMTAGILPIPVYSGDKHKQTPREHLPTPYGKQAQSAGTLGIQGLLLPLQVIWNHQEAKQTWHYFNIYTDFPAGKWNTQLYMG